MLVKVIGSLSAAFRRPVQYTCYATVRRTLSTDSGSPVDTGNDSLPPIPAYTPRVGESFEVKKARLIYQSRKRGMLENCLLLSTFASRYLNGMTDKQLDMYDNIINKPTNDWDIYYWTTGKEPTPEEYDNEVMKMIQKHVQNEEMEERFQQPPLH